MAGAETEGLVAATTGSTGTGIGLSPDGRTVTVRIPVALRRRAGRKVVAAPDDATAGLPARSQPPDSALVKALARAFRWRKLLENDGHTTIRELARAEGINESYISRIIRLTLLAPSEVDAIVEGRQPKDLTLGRLLRGASSGERAFVTGRS